MTVCATSSRLISSLPSHDEPRGRGQPRFVYTVPTHGNPTGATMPRERRAALVALARAQRARGGGERFAPAEIFDGYMS